MDNCLICQAPIVLGGLILQSFAEFILSIDFALKGHLRVFTTFTMRQNGIFSGIFVQQKHVSMFFLGTLQVNKSLGVLVGWV